MALGIYVWRTQEWCICGIFAGIGAQTAIIIRMHVGIIISYCPIQTGRALFPSSCNLTNKKQNNFFDYNS